MKHLVRSGSALSALALSALLVAGCGSGSSNSATAGTQVPAEDPLVEAAAKITGQVVDAATNEPIDNATVTLIGEGDLSRNGMFSYEPRFTTQQIERALVFRASAEGYVTSTGRVVVQRDSTPTVSIPLVRAATDAEGVVTSGPDGTSGRVEELSVDVNGVVTSEGAVSSPAVDRSGAPVASATVTVPANIRLLDASGNPVAGPVSLRLVSFDPSAGNDDYNPMDNFPGGLAVELARDETGQPDEGTMAPVWFAAIEMTGPDGRKVKSFDGGSAEVTVTLPAGTLHPVTGLPLQAGNTIPVWSYDDKNGKWSYDSHAEVIGSGPFSVSFAIDHPAFWTKAGYKSKRDGLVDDVDINILNSDGRELKIGAVFDNGEGYRYTSKYREGPFSIPNVPCGIPMELTAVMLDGTHVAYKVVNDICVDNDGDGRGGPWDLPVDFPAPVPDPIPGSIVVSVIEECKDGSNRRPVPSTAVFWEGPDKGNGVTDDNGALKIPGLAVGDYTVIAENRRGGEPLEKWVELSSDEKEKLEFVFKYRCQDVTGVTGGGTTGGTQL